MGRLKKQTTQRNMYTFYVREADKEIFAKFMDVVKEDHELTKEANKSNPGFNISIGIMTAIKLYLVLKAEAEESHEISVEA